ncbi:hypothetical protein LINGRAHAP2_LOCUS34760, partial [Linum grandiflorum]
PEKRGERKHSKRIEEGGRNEAPERKLQETTQSPPVSADQDPTSRYGLEAGQERRFPDVNWRGSFNSLLASNSQFGNIIDIS